ncbi:proline-rich protein 18 [Elgaria multicarinata webbii]|uniref:proline-rich protein 18 n=1 Tax=Elgaria multicarinata webbii TaxID=159646 RepID=UPI002FCCE73D
MSLPPIAPPPAAAPRLQPRKQQQPPPPPAAAPRKAAAAPLAPAKPPRKGRGAPAEQRSGAFSSSWPSAALQKQVSRSRAAAQGSRNPPAPPAATAAATIALAAPHSLARGRSVLGPPGSGTRSCESLCAAPGGRGEAAAALRFSLSLPPEAIRVLQRRSLEQQHQQRQRGRTPRSASPDAAKRPLAGGSAAAGDLRALLQVSLLNERHRYDDVEYEEEEEAAGGPGAPAADEGLVRKCTEWLRGVESAVARDRADKLDTLPHLSTL